MEETEADKEIKSKKKSASKRTRKMIWARRSEKRKAGRSRGSEAAII